MNFVKIRMTFAFALVLVMTATGLWAGGGTEEEPAAAMEKEMVLDPTTGKMVTAPEYGGTFTGPINFPPPKNADSYYGYTVHVAGVTERLGITNWAIDREEYPLKGYRPFSAITGALAESWEIPDPTTFIFNIRQGVRWHDKPPMNGRELTAKDVEYNFHRVTGMGSGFTEPSPMGRWSTLPFESITATDQWTVVMQLKEPDPLRDVLTLILDDHFVYIHGPEVIEQYGDVKDWRNLVGTGPYELTENVEGSSFTYIKNPDYWGYDEKYPANRLPYIDELRFLIMKEEATIMSALRTGKIDFRGDPSGGTSLGLLDQVETLQRTDPEIALWPFAFRSLHSFSFDVRKPPFDDIRVRHAMQMALDLETMNNSYFNGRGDTTPQGMNGIPGYYIPFEEWPEEIRKTYRYDPAGAEKLLDEAGYPRGADGIRFKTQYTQSERGDLGYAEIVIEYWREIGVDVDIIQVDAPTFNTVVNEHTYEGMIGSFQGGQFPPLTSTGWGSSNASWNFPGFQDPTMDAMVEAALAATDLEEQRRLIKEVDMYQIENRWHIWGPKVPNFQVSQPWLKGYNGETDLGPLAHYGALFARLWIDQDLKREMGF